MIVSVLPFIKLSVAGLELGMSLRARFPTCTITIIDSNHDILQDATEACRSALYKQLSQRNINVLSKSRVSRVSQDHVELEDGRFVDMTYCVWATGASAHALASNLKKRGVSCTPENWFRVTPTLQSLSHENIFAAGDCCSIEGLSDGRLAPPKAGLYG